MKKISIFLFVCIITTFACKKREQVHVYINADLKSHFNYKPGCYWIYRDSITGHEDSFFTVKNEFQTQELGESLVDDILISIRERSISPGYTDSSAWNVYLSSNKWNLVWGKNYPVRSCRQMPYPFTNQIIASLLDSPASINILSNYSCLGDTFNNVAEMHIPITEVQYDDWFYVTDSIGIMKMRISHPSDTLDHIWEIERWNIIK